MCCKDKDLNYRCHNLQRAAMKYCITWLLNMSGFLPWGHNHRKRTARKTSFSNKRSWKTLQSSNSHSTTIYQTYILRMWPNLFLLTAFIKMRKVKHSCVPYPQPKLSPLWSYHPYRSLCDGLNCVSTPKFICWSPYPQYLKMWLDLEIESLKTWLN